MKKLGRRGTRKPSHKGGAFERLIARELSLWVTGGQDNRQLIRSVSSGGWRGARGAGGWRQAGDLAPNGEAGEVFRACFAVECKHRRLIDLYGLWTRQRSDVRKWWVKLRQEAEEARVEPLLIFRANQRPVMAVVRREVWARLRGTAVVPERVQGQAAEFAVLDVVMVPFTAWKELEWERVRRVVQPEG